jgi:hypothetical protein
VNLQAIAERAREFVEQKYGNPPQGGCLEASKYIANMIREDGGKCRVVRGRFVLDDPDMSQYDEDADPEDARFPFHWWVRVGTIIVDVTADQFANEVNDHIDPICIGESADMSRWQPTTLKPFRSSGTVRAVREGVAIGS